MTVSEIPVPAVAQSGHVISPRAFCVEQGGCILGVMHSKKPANRDGTLRIHVSISKSRWDEVLVVTTDDIKAVEQVVLNKGVEWPAEYVTAPFEAGHFAGKGVHVWAADNTEAVK